MFASTNYLTEVLVVNASPTYENHSESRPEAQSQEERYHPLYVGAPGPARQGYGNFIHFVGYLDVRILIGYIFILGRRAPHATRSKHPLLQQRSHLARQVRGC